MLGNSLAFLLSFFTYNENEWCTCCHSFVFQRKKKVIQACINRMSERCVPSVQNEEPDTFLLVYTRIKRSTSCGQTVYLVGASDVTTHPSRACVSVRAQQLASECSGVRVSECVLLVECGNCPHALYEQPTCPNSARVAEDVTPTKTADASSQHSL